MKTPKKAMVIEIDGLDGSGKSTGLKLLADKLEAKGFKVLRTQEVGSPHIPVCAELRKVILNPEVKMDGMAMEFVFAAMRIENQKYYQSVSDKYDFILSDRGILSHFAYGEVNVNEEFVMKFYRGLFANYNEKPDKIIYFEVDPETASKRRINRGETPDAIEQKGKKFMEDVSKAFKRHIMTYGYIHLVDVVDADQDMDGVNKQLDEIADKLAEDRNA
jgi:dTMP kinase